MHKYIITRRHVVSAKDGVKAFNKYYSCHPSLRKDKYLYDVSFPEWTIKDELLDRIFEYLSQLDQKELEEELATPTDWLKPKDYKPDVNADTDEEV